MFSCKRWMLTELFTPARVNSTVETLASSKHGEIILKFISRREEKCDMFWYMWPLNGMKMPWYSTSSLLLLHFCLETMVRKETWMRRLLSLFWQIFFASGILKVSWSQLYSNFFLNNYGARWLQHFERWLFYSWLFYRRGSTCELNLSSRLG